MPAEAEKEWLERLEIAGKATPGPWYHVLAAIVGTRESPDDNDATCICFTEWGCSGDPQANAAHIAANSPDVVQADIEEILRLRRVERYLAERLVLSGILPGVHYGGDYTAYVTKEEAIQSWLDEANQACSGGVVMRLSKAQFQALMAVERGDVRLWYLPYMSRRERIDGAGANTVEALLGKGLIYLDRVPWTPFTEMPLSDKYALTASGKEALEDIRNGGGKYLLRT